MKVKTMWRRRRIMNNVSEEGEKKVNVNRDACEDEER